MLSFVTIFGEFCGITDIINCEKVQYDRSMIFGRQVPKMCMLWYKSKSPLTLCSALMRMHVMKQRMGFSTKAPRRGTKFECLKRKDECMDLSCILMAFAFIR
jgi:hypothetical protein